MNSNNLIKFISDFSKQIALCKDEYFLAKILQNITSNNDFIEEIEVYINNENSQKLKHFTKVWQKISNEEQKFLYNKFCLLDINTYATDNNFYKLTDKLSDINDFNFYFLISKNDIKLGLVKFSIKESFSNIIPILQILCNLISLCIINLTITSRMEGSIRFYNSMKDVAKIIESQYEPNYVIPLIGETIDKFLEQHLVYVFLKDEKGYKLAWPSACKQTKIIEALNDITIQNSYFLMDDMQTGVFGLISEKTILGAIVAHSNMDKLIPIQIDYLIQLSKQAATTMQRAYVYAEILEHATLDALTGLNNRRQFETRLNQEVATAKRKKSDLCCIMIDVDHFKSVNDTYGHLAGDCVLKNVAKLVKEQLREYDTACRYGGEEFIIILPFTSMQEAVFVAQRLRKVIEKTNIDVKEAHLENVSHINITISAGVSHYDEEKDNAQSFYQKADAALYDAKKSGRNRVIAYTT